jgi:hypothetical protein
MTTNNRLVALLLGGIILIGTAMYFAQHQDDLSMLQPTTDQNKEHSTWLCKVVDCSPSSN